MKAAVAAVAARVAGSGFGRGCVLIGELLDCVIPIVLFVAVTVSLGLIASGFVH